jgi:hypothetical protein
MDLLPKLEKSHSPISKVKKALINNGMMYKSNGTCIVRGRATVATENNMASVGTVELMYHYSHPTTPTRL